MKNKFIASSLGFMAFLAAQVTVLPQAQAAQSFTCNGSMNNGWNFTANFADGRFTNIRWNRSGQPPQTTELTYTDQNNAGQPYYTGSFQAATTVRLVDLSGGNVKPGSKISVFVEEWGTAEATCGMGGSSNNSGGGTTMAAPRIDEFGRNEITGQGCNMTLMLRSRNKNDDRFVFFNPDQPRDSMQMRISGQMMYFKRTQARGDAFNGQFNNQSFLSNDGTIAATVNVQRLPKTSQSELQPVQGRIRVFYAGKETTVPVIGTTGCQR